MIASLGSLAERGKRGMTVPTERAPPGSKPALAAVRLAWNAVGMHAHEDRDPCDLARDLPATTPTVDP